MKKILISTLFLLLLSTAAHAQTVSRTLSWTQPSDSLVNIQGYVFTAQVDALTPVILTTTCTGVAPTVACSAPIVFTAAAHTIVLTANNAFGSASASISGNPPGAPTGFNVTIRVTIP